MNEMQLLVLRNQQNYGVNLENAFILKDRHKCMLLIQDKKGELETQLCTNKHAAFGYLEFKYQEYKRNKAKPPEWYKCPSPPLQWLFYMIQGMPLFVYMHELYNYQLTFCVRDNRLVKFMEKYGVLLEVFPRIKEKMDFLIRCNPQQYYPPARRS